MAAGDPARPRGLFRGPAGPLGPGFARRAPCTAPGAAAAMMWAFWPYKWPAGPGDRGLATVCGGWKHWVVCNTWDSFNIFNTGGVRRPVFAF